ncbi:unnamed protein product [Dibothriocephalus latus]|uniref:Fibronectin type-III domain-containing protein n=1 Tax=Dibothriocephalus latus TaxID=60516 RepID=A0A3P6PWZ7_DIBLA|nr:unnamed protein product [Dibothriocephalus latus]
MQGDTKQANYVLRSGQRVEDHIYVAYKEILDNGGAPVSNYIVEKQDATTGDWVPVSKFVRQPEFEVTGLDEGKKYKFRVRAENPYGVGEPLEADRAITAENPIVPPGQVSGLEVTDVDADSVTLAWTKPRNTGNGKVSGYVVEYKPANGDEWIKAPGGSPKDTTATGLSL